MRNIQRTRAFKRDAEKVERQGKNMASLLSIIEALTQSRPLPSRIRDHTLAGKWKGCRECHIEPDWLLIYKVDGQDLILERTGSHSELFN